jgi:polysaccharide export outer membrane protein
MRTRFTVTIIGPVALVAVLLAVLPAWGQGKHPVRRVQRSQTAPPLNAPVGTSGEAKAEAVPTRASAQPIDYKLGPGDKLRVEVYKDAQLSQSLQVRPDGKITLPLIGDVQASGLTPIELRDRIATALREYVTNPVVTVIVVETIPPVAFIMGEVNSPGSIELHGPVSVLQALAMAGGFKDFANTKNIKVLRRSSRGQQTIAFNYKEALRADGAPMMLQPGDTVVVP